MAGLISRYRGTYVTAKSTSKDIDAEGIIAAGVGAKSYLDRKRDDDDDEFDLFDEDDIVDSDYLDLDDRDASLLDSYGNDDDLDFDAL